MLVDFTIVFIMNCIKIKLDINNNEDKYLYVIYTPTIIIPIQVNAVRNIEYAKQFL